MEQDVLGASLWKYYTFIIYKILAHLYTIDTDGKIF